MYPISYPTILFCVSYPAFLFSVSIYPALCILAPILPSLLSISCPFILFYRVSYPAILFSMSYPVILFSVSYPALCISLALFCHPSFLPSTLPSCPFSVLFHPAVCIIFHSIVSSFLFSSFFLPPYPACLLLLFYVSCVQLASRIPILSSVCCLPISLSSFLFFLSFDYVYSLLVFHSVLSLVLPLPPVLPPIVVCYLLTFPSSLPRTSS